MSSVTIIPYSPQWPALFDGLRRELVAVFAPTRIVVEHIGSTSVPGLASKPVIDVLLGANSVSDIESRIEALATLDYSYVKKYELELPERRYFVKSGPPRVHLHAVGLNSPLWREHLAFRDALCTDPVLRSEYGNLKLRLATEFAHDKSGYTAAKGAFIQFALRSPCPKAG